MTPSRRRDGDRRGRVPPGNRHGLRLDRDRGKRASGLVGDEDLAAIADTIEPGTSALVVLLEHTWARAVTAAIRDAGAVLVGAERLSAEVMNDVALAATT
jgi:hypothetical protein